MGSCLVWRGVSPPKSEQRFSRPPSSARRAPLSLARSPEEQSNAQKVSDTDEGVSIAALASECFVFSMCELEGGPALTEFCQIAHSTSHLKGGLGLGQSCARRRPNLVALFRFVARIASAEIKSPNNRARQILTTHTTVILAH